MVEQDARQPLSAHLSELRRRFIRCLVVLGVAVVVCMFFANDLVRLFNKPVLDVLERQQQVMIDKGDPRAMSFSPRLKEKFPGEALFVAVKTAFLAGLFIAIPFFLHQTWKFVSIALHEHEKRWVYFFGPFIVGSFVAGVLFAYFILLPFMLEFLISTTADWAEPDYTVSSVMSLLLLMSLAMGAVFELPLIMIFLTKVGLVQPATYAKYRKHWMVVAFIISAVVTPTVDPVSQAMFAAPLCLLYEIGIHMAKIPFGKILGARRREGA